MSLGYGVNDFDLTYCYVCWGARSSPNQTSTALLTTALIISLEYHLTGRISNLDGSLRDDCHSSVCTIHNGVQHKVYTKKATLLNTTQLQGQVSNAIPELGTMSPSAVPN